jgi:hypothetical protein
MLQSKEVLVHNRYIFGRFSPVAARHKPRRGKTKLTEHSIDYEVARALPYKEIRQIPDKTL